MTDHPATIAAALAELQQQLPHIAKDSKADIPNRPPHKYAALGSLSHELLPLMGKLGLSFSCKPTVRKGQFGMRYKLRLARTDEVEKGFWPIPGGQPQAQGSALTYYRRYTLQCLTGAVAEDDDDGAAAQAKPARTRAKVPGPDHERLRHGTVERTPDDIVTNRSRGPVPLGDDMWAGHEPGHFPKPPAYSTDPGSADEKQLKTIHTQLSTLGITDRDTALTKIEHILVGPLDGPHVAAEDGTTRTSKNLSRAEAEDVKAVLGEAIKAKKLAERAAQS